MAGENPAEAVQNQGGTYKDAVESLSVDEKLPLKQMPQGPAPQPFANLKRASGERSGG